MHGLAVGIAGGTGSGKSTISRGVVAALGAECLLVAHDRYYRSMPEAWRGREAHYNFDHPDALETPLLVRHLDALALGEAVVLPRYDFATHLRRPGGDQVSPCPVVIVEGILVLADPALRQRLDLAVFVDAPDAVRLARRIRRDTGRRGRDEASIRTQYAASVRPMHDAFVEPSRVHADLVLDGTGDIAGNVRRVLDAIQAAATADQGRSARTSRSRSSPSA